MKFQSVLPLILLGLTMVIIAPPAYAAIPSCNRTVTSNGFTYTLGLSPCSPSGVALNTVVTMTATTTEPSIIRVDFVVTDPTSAQTAYTVTPSPFTTSFTANMPGTWYVMAVFCNSNPTGTCVNTIYDVISFSVSLLVLNALPLGTASAMGISLLGLVAYQRIKKRPLPA